MTGWMTGFFLGLALTLVACVPDRKPPEPRRERPRQEPGRVAPSPRPPVLDDRAWYDA